MTTPSSFETDVPQHALKGLLIDTNVLLMYLVGCHDAEFIPKFKRTQKYTSEDFQIARNFIHRFHRLVTTPHILSELSNLSRGIRDRRAAQYFAALGAVLKPAQEAYAKKDVLLDDKRLPRLGFTDLSILEAARQSRCFVLTDDFELAGVLRAEGIEVANFHHVRQMSWSN